MEETVTNASDVDNFKLKRCTDWLLQQNNPDKLTRQNQNDIQFIIETNAHRKKFFLSAAEDEATVPTGVDENTVEPATVVYIDIVYAMCLIFLNISLTLIIYL